MKLMFNEDWIHFIWTRFEQNIQVSEDVLKEFIYQYKDTQITDFAMNVNGTVSTFPSRIKQDFCDKYLVKEENGIKVDYSETFAKKAYEIFVEKNLDMYAVWINTLNEIGINTWISIRINDVHGNADEVELRKSEQVDTRPEKWRIRHRNAVGYYDRTQDFELEEVRKDFLGYVEEILTRYNGIYGLELDFTREAYTFAPGREKAGREILNNLMKAVRELCDKYSVKKINVLVPATVQTCLDYGLDPVKWAKNGSVDSVVILSHWQTINTDYQIDLWKKLLDGKVELGAGQQLNVSAYPDAESVLVSADISYGQACANLYNGSDFVYLYNYMDLLESGIADGYYPGSVRDAKQQKELFSSLGDYDTASKHKRAHVLSFNDYCPYWEGLSSRLPVKFNVGERYETIKIITGGVREDEIGLVRLGFDKEIANTDITVYVNRTKAEFKEYGEIHERITNTIGHIFEIKNNADIDGYAIIEIQVKIPATLKYADITILP